MEKSTIIIEKAPQILEEIKKSSSILLHCHPSPDSDSIGSVLAMQEVLLAMGKKVTVIQGDSQLPEAFKHLPGSSQIIPKNYFEIDTSEYDLFVILDTAALQMISRRGEIFFPQNMRTVLIDHHITNNIKADIVLLEPHTLSTCEILYELFSIWNIEITTEIACNLFVGIYSDTGGLKFEGVNSKTYEIAAELSKKIPNIYELIGNIINSETENSLKYLGIALNSIKTYLDNRLAISMVSNEIIKENHFLDEDISMGKVALFMRTVNTWFVMVSMVEFEKGIVKASFRTQDPKKYDVSLLAQTLGGGGHKAASGAIIRGTIEEAIAIVVAKVKELYNL